MTIRRYTTVASLMLVFGAITTPAYAWVAPEPAPNTPAPLVEFVAASGILAPLPPGDPWAPSGRQIRDTGFTPTDGLGFLNYSNASNNLPNEINMFYLGVPDKNPVNLRNKDVVKLLGTSACVDGKLPCTLTLSALEWKRGVNAGMAAGHCWGIATTVAQIFNGDLALKDVGGKSTMDRTVWSNALTRQIARAWASQDALNLDEYAVSPRTAVKKLKKQLKPGLVPYAIAITSVTGDGHGVTPVGLYRTGKDTYKIAIYDNNYPGRLRAMNVDVASNTFEYNMFTIPGQPPMMATGKLKLVPISVLDKPLPCPFCGGSVPAEVQVEPVPTQDNVSVNVTAWDGANIPGVVHHQPTDPSGLVGVRPFGKFEVPTGKNFAVRVDASALTEQVVTAVRVVDGGVTYVLSELLLNPGAVVTLYVDPKQGFATVKSSEATEFNLAGIDTTGGQEWAFTYGTLQVAKGGEVTLTVDDEKFMSTMSFKGTPAQQLQVLATFGTASGAQSVITEAYAQEPGGVTLVQFKRWNTAKPGALKVSVAATPDGSYTPLRYAALD